MMMSANISGSPNSSAKNASASGAGDDTSDEGMGNNYDNDNLPNVVDSHISDEKGSSPDDSYSNDAILTATTEWTKHRSTGNRPSRADVEVGALQIDDPAPQLNIRFFRGLTRPSAIARNRRARRERRRRRQFAEGDANNDNAGEDGNVVLHDAKTAAGEEGRSAQAGVEEETTKNILKTGGEELLVSATLVEENEAEVVEAKPVSLLERRWKRLALVTIFCLCLVLALVLAVVFSESNSIEIHDSTEMDKKAREYCSPCIERGSYTIKVMIYGTADDLYWSEFSTSAVRATNNTGINLILDFYDHEKFTEKEMASDIRAAGEPDSGINALIVNIPSKTVATAVRYVAEKGAETGKGFPVFGVGSGYDLASGSGGLIEDESLLFYTGMNESSAGELAASYFLHDYNNFDSDSVSSSTPNRTAESSVHSLFITPLGIGNNSTYQKRFEGYRDQLVDSSNGTINIEWIEISHPYVSNLRKALPGCKYQSILVGSESGSFTRDLVHAILDNRCQQTKVGAFGISPEVEYQITKGGLDFAVAQNAWLQGWISVQLAGIYVTTAGLIPVPPPAGVYSTGPTLYTKENFTLSTVATNFIGSENITIGGVLNGAKDDEFWDPVYAGAFQGAKDMGVQLILEHDEVNLQHSEALSAKILKLCMSGVDGLFVTLVDEVVADAVRQCKENYPHIKLLSVNAGYGLSNKLDILHHVGMVEKDAGFQAGKKMENMASVEKAICVNPDPGARVFVNRCAGFGEAMNEVGIEYVGQINITNRDVWDEDEPALDSIVRDGDSYGILLVSATIQLPAALDFKRNNSNVVLGTFDTSPELYDSLQTGDVLFGIDQQPYLQGFLPVPILTHAIMSGQSIDNHLINTGPSFIIAPLTDEEASCKEMNFPVCNGTQLTTSLAPTGTTEPSTTFQPSPSPTGSPTLSVQPTSLPTFDSRPTVEKIQERGHILCGILAETIESGGYKVDLCRAVASVLLGDAGKIVKVTVTAADRFIKLNDRTIDILVAGDTHTVEREVMETTTGVGLTFSAPYYYDGMAYYGVEALVRCAEDARRYGECSSMKICTLEATSSLQYLKATFPSRFFSKTSTVTDLERKIMNGTCNVLASDRSLLLDVASRADTEDAKFVIGDKLMTKEPLAIVTRKYDRAFSDAINWIVQALYYGEERDLTKDASLCQNVSSSNVSELNFMNAVHCVGNYRDIVFGSDTQANRGMNRINNGESGMLYPIPFGALDRENDDEGSFVSADGLQQLSRLIQIGSLNCGVAIPTVAKDDSIVSMSADYCKTIAAALFHGNSEAVNIKILSSKDAFAALSNGTIDVLAGGRVEQKLDLGSPPSHKGFQFSTAYYHGNGTASDDVISYSLVTQEDDIIKEKGQGRSLFSSFINMIVLATIYAQEKGIDRSKSKEMPLVSVFGDEFAWAMRDAISHSGRYEEIYTKHFGALEKEDRGRNTLNDEGGPQLHSFPFIDSGSMGK